jgi:hypothetical protein
MRLSRYDGRFDAAAEIAIDAAELVAALEARAEARSRERQDAIACFLSGSEGWQEALSLLGGAFAAERTTGRPKND